MRGRKRGLPSSPFFLDWISFTKSSTNRLPLPTHFLIDPDRLVASKCPHHVLPDKELASKCDPFHGPRPASLLLPSFALFFLFLNCGDIVNLLWIGYFTEADTSLVSQPRTDWPDQPHSMFSNHSSVRLGVSTSSKSYLAYFPSESLRSSFKTVKTAEQSRLTRIKSVTQLHNHSFNTLMAPKSSAETSPPVGK